MALLESALISVLEFFNGLTGSYVLSLILLSAFVSLSLAPLYHLTGILEKKERIIKQRLAMYKPSTHKNLNELYERFGYWPFYSIRSLASLFIQIPILIAAYEALSNYEPLKSSWLGYPDNTLHGSNLFPFIMTLINLCAVFVSSEPESKERKQGIFIAMIFLILLYTSPSALLIYWIFNQLFTLIRYLMVYPFPKIKRPNLNFIAKAKIPFSVPNLQTIALNISVMAFPAILFFKSNEIYFEGMELIFYFTILLLFSILVSFISFPRFSVSLILTIMFLPIVRDATFYMETQRISFAILFIVVFMLIGSVIRQKGAIIAFSLVASFYSLFFIENANSKSKGLKARTEIPEELAALELKDSASIYLFMHDAFPHKDYAEHFDFPNYNELMNIFESNDFKIYDVYSMGHNTLFAMSSLFGIRTDILPKHDGITTVNEPAVVNKFPISNTFDYGYFRSIISGNSITNALLQKKDYITAYLSPLPSAYSLFRGDRFYNFEFIDSTKKHENKAENQVLKNILKGTLNSALAYDSLFASHLISIAKFIQKNPERHKFFLWGGGCPEHSTRGSLGTTEKELQRFIPIYNECIEAMKKEIEMLKTNSNAIIIFMSDHGGYFIDDGHIILKNYYFNEVNYMKFRDLFGAFMAVRWPNREKAEKYDGDFNVSQNLFPVVFAYLFDNEIPLKYKIKNTEVRLGQHKFDKGVFYPNFYSGDSK
jgi:hypothetical protein